MPIRTRLLILVLSILVPAFLAAAYAVWYVYTEQKQAQIKALTETANALALLIDTEVETSEGILQSLASSPILQNKDFDAFHGFAKSMSDLKKVNIVLSDPQGNHLLNSLLPKNAAKLPKSRANLVELRKRFGPEATIVSDMYIGPVTSTYNYAVQVPVRIGNGIPYYVSMGTPVERMQALLERQKLPQSWLGVIVDRKGITVARTRDPERFVGHPVNEALYRKLLTRQEGVHHGTTKDGIPSAGFFSHSPMSQWAVIVSIPEAELQRSAFHAATVLGSIMAVMLLAALLVARQVGKKIARPVESLRSAAEHLGKGEHVYVAPSGIMEMDLVGREISQASHEIRQNKSMLEQRVAEAVASSEQAHRALLQAQKLEALGRLTGGIAHDFNNVLQTLSTSLYLAQLSTDKPDVMSMLDTAQKAVERASALTGQLRTFGRVQESHLETIDLGSHMSGIVQLLQNTLPSDIEFKLKSESAIWPVKVDTLQLELALLNIVINARDSMTSGGTIRIDVRNAALQSMQDGLQTGEYVVISTADNGSGMSPEVLSKALDPFYTTKPVGQGTGLGLSQAYGFARQSGGTLTIQSEEGKGTTVIIYLPKASGPVLVSAHARMPIGNAGQGKHVLFVDDDALVREVMPSALSKAGFQVTIASDGREAMSLMSSGMQFDAVLSDIVMPGEVSGIDLAQFVRNSFPNTHIVLATGYYDKNVDLPGVRLLRKPYDVSDAIEALLQAIGFK